MLEESIAGTKELIKGCQSVFDSTFNVPFITFLPPIASFSFVYR